MTTSSTTTPAAVEKSSKKSSSSSKKINASSLAPTVDMVNGSHNYSVLSKEIMSKQATINIGTIGHVAHGKSTVVKGLSGVHTVKFKQEKERNITIKLGYANCKIYKCNNPECPRPGNYCARGSSHPDTFIDEKTGFKWELERHVSFVDCPGHDTLMATMLNGAAVMDGALLLIAANEPCPQPQTREHLGAIEIMKLKNIIVCQNKVELITMEQAELQMEEIKKFIDGTPAKNAPIVPISAVFGYNLDVLAEYICTQIPIPIRDFSSKPEMMVIRSFDVNKPGQEIDDITGGVAGGSILRGVLKVGDEVEVRPGIITSTNGGFTCTPIRTRIVSLHAERNELQYAVPGSLIGLGTLMDPSLTRADKLVGSIIGVPGSLPGVYTQITVSYQLMKYLVGAKKSSSSQQPSSASAMTAAALSGKKIDKLAESEILRVNIGSTSTGAKVKSIAAKESSSVKTEEEGSSSSKKAENNKKKAKASCTFDLMQPVCARIGNRITISRRYDQHWRLIGNGKILNGQLVDGIDESNSQL